MGASAPGSGMGAPVARRLAADAPLLGCPERHHRQFQGRLCRRGQLSRAVQEGRHRAHCRNARLGGPSPAGHERAVRLREVRTPS